MSLMKAVQVPAPGAEFEFVQKEIPEPKETEVRIKSGSLRNLSWRCGCEGRKISRSELSQSSRP